ncbi:hypothetical protein N7532_011803 [Penicillium argentinense]|uniref:Xylanolytic transcriptional activator regulatory domain-containing protein n=1 Tax=Penicillium argentinense TaxID=1131581 RepID=A0A9W9EJA8_9EURO|nr:uncharacterized protein N7532_011803 [Penicillium argentinense]KAJ5082760.1 hypothetical protein N7532_011803 [Penicillium argentinense]
MRLKRASQIKPLLMISLSRPTKAVVNALQSENRKINALVQRLKDATTPEELWQTFHSGEDEDGAKSVQPRGARTPPTSSYSHNASPNEEKVNNRPEETEFVQLVSDQTTFDASSYVSVDESGNFNSFGPSSAWQMITDTPKTIQSAANFNTKNTLVANAALTRQLEYQLATLGELDGVPIDLATHLLDLHCIFACASKFSTRPELREKFGDSKTAGSHFFRQCDELISQENLLLQPSLSTIVGLLLLGSTHVARGVTTKGWLLTGYALRMVYDLGLHIDRKGVENDAVGEEARKRIFWGAFICDKLQSLYLGRPFAIKLRDAHVSLELNDIIEENELWTPYKDPTMGTAENGSDYQPRFPTYSVSCFQHLCLLSKIMTRIIDEFYVVGATVASAQSSLRSIDDLLRQWEGNLPDGLRIDPENRKMRIASQAPNVLCLHVIYNALIILLHCPLVADGHLRSASPPVVSWRRCSEAAERITQIVALYRQLYTLRGAPYLVSYGLYVACTIHVRNAGANTHTVASEHGNKLERSVRWLEELAVPNPAVEKTISIIRKLMSVRGVSLTACTISSGDTAHEEQFDTEESYGSHSESVNSDLGPSLWEDKGFFINAWDESFSDDVLYGFMEQQSFDG